MIIYFYISNILHIFATEFICLCKGRNKIRNYARLYIIYNMITSEEPKVNPTARYTIGETCVILGIHRNTLRSYVRAGYIKNVQKLHGQRFKGSEISRFWHAFV